MSFGRTVLAGILVLAVWTAVSWFFGIPPFSRNKVSPELPGVGPPRLQIVPNRLYFAIGHRYIVEKEKVSDNWQFQTSIFVENPSSVPIDDAFIRTCFFTGKKDGWTSELSGWMLRNCLEGLFPGDHLLTGFEDPSSPYKLQPYRDISGKLAKYIPKSHGPMAAADRGCFDAPKPRRFEPGERIEHLLFPQLADDPGKYLCDGSAIAFLRVSLSWEVDGHTIEYLPVQCTTDPNPKQGEPSKKLFRWTDETFSSLPKGIEPLEKCIFPSMESQQ